MAKYSPVYCGLCASANAPETPPEAQTCPHFAAANPDQLWLAMAGGALAEAEERPDRRHTKYYLHHPVDWPTHHGFQPVIREKNTWSDTFKLPLTNGARMHYEACPHDQWFAMMHGPEVDPDPPADGQGLLAHLLEVVGHDAATVRERSRLGRTRYQDPLYIYPNDQDIALNVLAPPTHGATGRRPA